MSGLILKRGFFAFVMAAGFVCLLSGCGGDTGSSDLIEAAPAESLGGLDQVEELIFSDEYAGYLILHIDESLGARVDEQTKAIVSKIPLLYPPEADPPLEDKEGRGEVEPLPSLSLPYKGRELSTLVSIQKTIESHPSAKFSRVIKASPDAADARRARLEKLSGKKLADMNSIIRIDVADSVEAVKLYRELKGMAGVSKVYPYQKGHPTSIDDVSDLTPYQLSGSWGYLGDLNARAAWDAGVHGENTILIDGESDSSPDHEDTPFDRDHAIGRMFCDLSPGDPNCPSWINHGTAVIGVMAALANGHGITGIAYGADVYNTDFGGDMSYYLDGEGDSIYEELPPGSIFVVEEGVFGALGDYSSGSQYGGLPMEVRPIDFDATEVTVAAGITVISAAANGSISLDDPAVYRPLQMHITPENDSGSILVGSSWGATLEGPPHNIPNRTKRLDSNWGGRVNTFAWGHNVMTTGYPYAGNPYVWNPIAGVPDPNAASGNDPNAYFINNFGGTSAAAAMVGGVAALIQSYAKREFAELGGSDALVTTRYLMPLKMREILAASGVPQMPRVDSECTAEMQPCNIGTQPRVDVAMTLVDAFVAEMRAAYPEIETGEMLTEARMIAMRRAGLGIVCKFRDPLGSDIVCGDDYRCRPHEEGPSDFDCPEGYIWPTGTGIGKDLDFDGDGRADLVQWTNPSTGSGRGGTWKLDLSSRGSGGDPAPDGAGRDNFGSWDIEIAHPPISGQWVWPYVSDMNSDGRTDFVVYDKEHGRWFISFTDTPLINNGTWHGWDLILDYGDEWHDELKLRPLDCTTGTGPNCTNYSRPAIGDYDGDGWNDVAIAASDGFWRIDHDVHTLVETNSTGIMTRVFDQSVRYLSDEQLAAAPGWAYTTSPYYMGTWRRISVNYKYPDGISPDDGRYVSLPSTEDPSVDLMEGLPHFYGGSGDVVMPGKYESPTWWAGLGIKRNDGTWPIVPFDDYSETWLELTAPEPLDIFGDSSCRPTVADFDGDGKSDRTVMCPNEWRIAYSSDGLFIDQRNPDGARRISLTANTDVLALPGRSYSGGISYGQVRRLIEFYQRIHPDTPPSIPVDMP